MSNVNSVDLENRARNKKAPLGGAFYQQSLNQAATILT
jgi:hypothetical protein